MPTTRQLVLVLGDQLSHDSAAFDGFDAARDVVRMAEVADETEHVWCSKLRIAVFFSAMRHFRDELERKKRRVRYAEMTADPSADRVKTFGDVLAEDARALRPERVVVVEPGDWRVRARLEETARALGVPLDVREDRHSYCSRAEFDAWAREHPGLLLEAFYEHMRRKHRVLVGADGEPEGGRWSWDVENRERFTKGRSPSAPKPRRFVPDATTSAVLRLVQQRFADRPGSLERFDAPVTRTQARALLRDFLDHRLPHFGPYEDAMWTDEPLLFHSRLSMPLNLKLLDPRECVGGAIERYREGRADLRSVEGFVRQILGWRELVRGVYWRFMPGYAAGNALGCGGRDVPRFFWDGETDMSCVRHAMRSVLEAGYAHHIQRLMVLGNFALLAGVHPLRFHEWHMAMYLDAIDWVSLPNALGMSQYGDGGVVGTKPYAASAHYIDRMSNYCGGCRYDPKRAVGEGACPYNALYWDFLARHRRLFASNARMNLAMRNLARKDPRELARVRARARELLERLDRGERI